MSSPLQEDLPYSTKKQPQVKAEIFITTVWQLAETKRSTKHLHFMALEFGITYLQKSL